MERLRRADEDKRDAAAAKNELESYILATRSRVRAVSGTLISHGGPALHCVNPGLRTHTSAH